MTYSLPPAEDLKQYGQQHLNQALAIIEQFITLRQDFAEFLQCVPQDKQVQAAALLSRLEVLVNVLDTEAVPVPLLQEEKLSGSRYRSEIERLGIAGELVRLRGEKKTSVKDLSTMFGVTEGTIYRFFRYYDQLKPSEKAKVKGRSIFDATERLEELSVIIYRQLARLEASNDEVHVKYVSELRQTIELATKLTEKMLSYQTYMELVRAVHDLLAGELPHRRKEILGKMSALGAVMKDAMILGSD